MIQNRPAPSWLTATTAAIVLCFAVAAGYVGYLAYETRNTTPLNVIANNTMAGYTLNGISLKMQVSVRILMAAGLHWALKQVLNLLLGVVRQLQHKTKNPAEARSTPHANSK